MQKLAASVIISVYNNFQFLEWVLTGFELQTRKNFEIIVSDDGSGPDFIEKLSRYQKNSSLRIRHSWHEDIGFRKNKILNQSVGMASSAYLIFVDGDCIPHPEFIEEHLKNSEPGFCLAGRRVDLSKRLTAKLNTETIRNGWLWSGGFKQEMFTDFVKGSLKHFMNGVYIRSGMLRKFLNRKPRGLLGANFSLYKTDMLAINGFDERYIQPTFGEDSDIEFRLRLNNVEFKSLLSIAVLYHVNHPLLPRPEESKALYEKVVRERIAFTPYGILRGKTIQRV